MFEIAEFPNSPRIARRLIDMSNIGGLIISEEIKEFASKDLLTPKDFINFVHPLSLKEIKTIQFIKDRNGRAVILETPAISAYSSVLGYVYVENKFPLLIVTNFNLQDKWLREVRSVWPNKIINVYQPGFTQEEIRPNVSKVSELTYGCEIVITKPSCVYKNDLLKNTRFNQVIISYVADLGSSTKIVSDSTKNLCIELPSVLFLSNLHQCVSAGRSKDKFGISDVNWCKPNTALNASLGYLNPQSTLAPYIFGEHDWVNRHLEENGITLDRSKWLPILDICPHLVE